MTHPVRSTRARKRRARLPRIALLLLMGSCVGYQLSTTRGHVERQGRPVAGADVVLADSSRVLARGRTDARGRFFLWRGSNGRDDRMLVICAPGLAPMVVAPASSALLYSKYGVIERVPEVPWPVGHPPPRVPLPASCPPRRRVARPATLSNVALQLTAAELWR